jgi:hypothetical protein
VRTQRCRLPPLLVKKDGQVAHLSTTMRRPRNPTATATAANWATERDSNRSFEQ